MKYLKQIQKEYHALPSDQQLKLLYGTGLSIFAIVLGCLFL